MDLMSPKNPAYALVWRGLRHVFEGGPAAQRRAVLLIYATLGPLAIVMSIVIAGGSDWPRIAAPKTAVIVGAMVWLAVR